jgi:hypothetical protein
VSFVVFLKVAWWQVAPGAFSQHHQHHRHHHNAFTNTSAGVAPDMCPPRALLFKQRLHPHHHYIFIVNNFTIPLPSLLLGWQQHCIHQVGHGLQSSMNEWMNELAQ